MIIKVVAQIENNCFERIYEIPENGQNLDAYNEGFEEAVKKWKKYCNGKKNSQRMFDKFEEILDDYDIEYYSYEDMVDEIIKAKA